MAEGIHGGGGHGHAGEGGGYFAGEKLGGLDGKDLSTSIAKKREDESEEAQNHQQKELAYQQDVQESANVSQDTQPENVTDISKGLRYSTLSQHQLDFHDLNNHNPNLKDVNQLVVHNGPPPSNKGGMGNPFFNTNALVAVFAVYLALIKVEGLLEQAAARLVVINMLATKDTGLEQANATLQAGKAQATSDFIQGGIAVGMGAELLIDLGASVKGDMNAGKDAAGMGPKESEEADDAEASADDAENTSDEAANVFKGQQRADNQPDAAVSLQDPAVASQKAKITRAKAQQKYTKAQQDYQQAVMDKKKIMKNDELSEEEKQAKLKEKKLDEDSLNTRKNNLANAQKDKNAAIEEDEYWNARGMSQGQRKKNLQQNQRAAQQAKINEQEARRAATQKRQEARSYDFSSTNVRARLKAKEIKESYSWFNNIKMGTQIFQQLGQAGQSFAKGWGEQQSAYWQATSQIFQTYNQMIQQGLSGATNMMQNAYQDGNTNVQALIKMSDQETQSMHWAA